MKRFLLLILTLGLFSGAAYAHNGMTHVMGTVAAVTDTGVSVKAMNGTVQTVALTADTKYLRGDSAVAAKDIKVGDHIVIHATGKADHLIASEVKVGAMKMTTGMKMEAASHPSPH